MSQYRVIQRNSNNNPLETLLNFLPCDRPIRSIQLLENVEGCSPQFVVVDKTLDSDTDADLLKENVLFGKKTTRYISYSKNDGVPNHLVEKLKILNVNENLASEGFISIKTTTDTNQKAWRKKQLVYKLSKTESITSFISDIIVLTKFRSAPDGFTYLGELERVHICYKVSPIIDFNQQIENLKLQSNIYPGAEEHYYESLRTSYQLPSSPTNPPMRRAPMPPLDTMSYNTLTHYHNDFVGIPFVLHQRLNFDAGDLFEVPIFSELDVSSEYDFTLERQICTIHRKPTSTNPFFNSA